MAPSATIDDVYDPKDTRRTSSGLTLPLELIETLEALAVYSECPKSLVAEAALAYALERTEEWDERLDELRLERLEKPNAFKSKPRLRYFVPEPLRHGIVVYGKTDYEKAALERSVDRQIKKRFGP